MNELNETQKEAFEIIKMQLISINNSMDIMRFKNKYSDNPDAVIDNILFSTQVLIKKLRSIGYENNTKTIYDL